MIEKIEITNAGIISSIEGKLNVKNIRDGMFPTWQLTLQAGEEYNLGTGYYGMYMVRWPAEGTTALIMIGAAASTNILLNDGEGISTDFTASGKLILNKKKRTATYLQKIHGRQKLALWLCRSLITKQYRGTMPLYL